MAKSIYHRYQLAEARGHVPAGLSAKLTCATVLLSGAKAFHEAYFGAKAYQEAAEKVSSARTEAEQFAGSVQESLLSDLTRKTLRPLQEAHSTSDFPLVLAQLRNIVLRAQYSPVESDIISFCAKRTANDFRLLNGVRLSALSDLPVRPEGTSVEYTTLQQSRDGYRVANYERAIGYTWEMYLSDDLSIFTQALAQLGLAARRTRQLAVFQAIRDGVSAQVLGGSAGGPSIARITAMVQSFAEQVNDNNDAMPRMLSDLFVPASWQVDLKTVLNSTNVIGPTSAQAGNSNPVYNIATPHIEPMMAKLLGRDWIGMDTSAPSIEFATLAGFEGGPRTYTKMPDVEEHLEEGAFDDHTMAVKVGDVVGAKVIDATMIRRAQGA